VPEIEKGAISVPEIENPRWQYQVEAKSLWDPIDLVAGAISVPEIELSGFEESPLVSPIVRIFNERVILPEIYIGAGNRILCRKWN
jgi:hypothetical protein